MFARTANGAQEKSFLHSIKSSAIRSVVRFESRLSISAQSFVRCRPGFAHTPAKGFHSGRSSVHQRSKPVQSICDLLWTDILCARSLAPHGQSSDSMLLNNNPKHPDQHILKFARWLDLRLPNKAIYTFPFDKASEAFASGKTIKLRVVEVSKYKHSVELWIDK